MYDGLKHSCIEGGHIVNIFSFSKGYRMMGWRVGYGLMVLHINFLKSKTTYDMFFINLIKTSSSLNGSDCAVKVQEGVIYLWAKLPEKFIDDFEVLRWLANMHHVVLIPLTPCGCPVHVRISFSGLVEKDCQQPRETDGEAIIISIKNGDQSLPRVTQVLIARTSSTEQPPLKDKSMWKVLGSEYGEQDRKATILYEYEMFKATEGELFLDTYIRYLQVINDLKKCGYLKDNCELNVKFLNNLQPEWKQYATMMRQNKNLMDINIDALYNILKQNQGDVNDAMRLKKKTIVGTSDPLAVIVEKTKVSKRKEKVVVSLDSEGSDEDDFSELKKITTLLAKAFNRKNFYSKPTNNNLRTSPASISANKNKRHFAKDCKKAKEINANMVFMAQMEEVLLDLEKSSSSSDETIAEEKNNELNEQIKVLIEKNTDFLPQTNVLKEQLKVKHVVIDMHAEYQEKYAKLEAERYKARENKIKFANDYGNLNASYVNEKINLSDDYFQEIINPDFDKIDSSFQQTSSLKPYVPTVILEKIIIDLEYEVKKGSSNTVKADLSSINHYNLNKNVKRYNRKDLLSCNNSHLVDTKSKYDCNVAMHVDCNSYDDDVNDLFVFNDVSLRKSQVRKMPFRKKPHASLNMPSRNNLKKSLSRNVLKWLPKLQPLAEPVAKWIPRVKRCSKHMTGNRVLLTNFVEKFLRTVRFGNNDFTVIVGYGDVVIGSMTIKRVYYVEGLVSQVEETSKKDLEDLFQKIYDEYFDASKLKKSLTTNVKTSNNEGEVFHEVSESFQGESSSSLLNDDVQQSQEEVILPQTNTQSISNDMIPNVDEASSSHNVFNELLEDAYFDAIITFHDTSDVHTYYQPYPHETKWTKDHPHYK
uniref:Aromatic aminotransferase ISS1 n=1 Tax=Tanacetum cinerariifolium TaxID=118510 RepID=A0A699GRZ0_TANCI|nr:aromatic aminotransferase ISS1 [Tanacetum cinerariifolium]